MTQMNRRRLLGAAAVGGAAGLASGMGAGAAFADQPTKAPKGWDCLPPMRPVKVTPDDPRYADLLLRGNNGRFRGEPDYVRLVGSTDQVVDAVDEAVRANKRIAVRSGGHCFEDFVDNPDVQVVIDLSQLNDVSYDPRMNAFLIEPGNTLWDVFQQLYLGWGVTIPGGNCGGVGVGGHICGGGYGPLSRQLGSVVDYLHAVEVVTVGRSGKARAVVATSDPDDPHHDLWWAHTGGGGGNFGVVTKYWMRVPEDVGRDPERLLPKPPATVLTSSVYLPWQGMTEESFGRLVRNHGSWFEQNSAPDSPYTGMWSVLMLTGTLPGADPGGLLYAVQMDATVPNARRLLDEHLAAIVQGIEPKPDIPPHTEAPWLASARALRSGEAVESGPSKVKAGYLRKRLTDQQIRTVYTYLTDDTTSIEYGALWLVAYGGKVNTVDPAATASPQRDSILKAIYLTGWSDPASEQPSLAWVRKFYAEVYAETGGVPAPSDNSDGSYINYPDSDLADPEQNTSGIPWHELYYKENYPRLRKVKAAYDPRNVFHHTLSVRP